jgi:hypothetical protein
MVTETPPIPQTPPRQAPPPPSPFKQLAEIIEQHVKLAMLEARYELVFIVKRAIALGISAFLGLTVYCLLQVALVHGFMKAGLPLWAACLAVCALYGIGIAVLVFKVGKRDLKSGGAFQASREEWQRSREWMRKRFF